MVIVASIVKVLAHNNEGKHVFYELFIKPATQVKFPFIGSGLYITCGVRFTQEVLNCNERTENLAIFWSIFVWSQSSQTGCALCTIIDKDKYGSKNVD